MKLHELKIGDRFYPKSKVDKATPIFEVKYNNGGPLIQCINRKNNTEVWKRKSLEVIKTGPVTAKHMGQCM